jgi:hypothetical protein
MHLPLEMVNRIVSSSTYEFNEFKTYLSFAFHTSGNCNLNISLKNRISNHLGISQKTLNKHIQSLIEKKYFGYNSKTNTIFINGLKKIKKLVYVNNNFDEKILTKTSFVLNISNFNELKFLTFSATEKLILTYQSSHKKRLKFEEFLISKNLIKRYENGNDNTKRNLKRFYQLEVNAKGDSIKKANPNHFSNNNLYTDDNDYLGISNSFISKRYNRSKSWGCKMKKKSTSLSLLEHNKKYKFIDSFPLNFNVRKYLSISCPEKYNRYITKRVNDMILVYETGYDEIISNVKLSSRRNK